MRLLPNPAGNENENDNDNEEVAIKNFGIDPARLVGWTLRDKVPTVWMLDSLGTILLGEEKTIQRIGYQMALNRGVVIDIVDSNGTVRHTVFYATVDEGEIVEP